MTTPVFDITKTLAEFEKHKEILKTMKINEPILFGEGKEMEKCSLNLEIKEG
jgi:hypothetical protein